VRQAIALKFGTSPRMKAGRNHVVTIEIFATRARHRGVRPLQNHANSGSSKNRACDQVPCLQYKYQRYASEAAGRPTTGSPSSGPRRRRAFSLDCQRGDPRRRDQSREEHFAARPAAPSDGDIPLRSIPCPSARWRNAPAVGIGKAMQTAFDTSSGGASETRLAR